MTDSHEWLENLTERERDVLRLLADGLSNPEIADRLFVAPSTVKWYVRQLNSKFDTENRDAIVARAQALGLLDTTTEATRKPTPHNLLDAVTPFIGREQEQAEILTILAKPDVRLLTILATGGMGKTRIAIEIARQQLERFSDGVFMVELAPISIFDSQLAASLKFLAENLRRGYNMGQGFAWIAELAPEPTASAFRNLRESLSQGTPLLEAIIALQTRLQSPHFDRFVTMFQRQLSEGGNFADRLDELIAWLQTQVSSDAWFDPRLPAGLVEIGHLLRDGVDLPQALLFASESLAEPYNFEFESLVERTSEITPLEALQELRRHFHSRHYDRFCEALQVFDKNPAMLTQTIQWLEQEIEEAPQRQQNSLYNRIAIAIAQACRIPLPVERQSALTTIRDYLAEKQIFLVLDNWEHLLDGAGIIAELLQSAPRLKVLATSREKLNLSGETVFPLRGLAFPSWETPEDALRYDAVQLLLQSAQRVNPDFHITAQNLDAVARVCRLTEGMPLGIILAVSWLDTLSLAEIAQEIQQSADFLETNMRDLPERQRSIRAVFLQAWNRLQPAEQDAFMKCAVFRGGFTRASAEAITGIGLRTLQSLVNKALLIRDTEGRYDIHELLRQYGEMALRASGKAKEAQDAHAQYFSGFVLSHDVAFRSGNQQTMREIERDFENLQIAWRYAIEQQQVDWLDRFLKPISFWMLGQLNGRLDEVLNLINESIDMLFRLPDSLPVRLARGRACTHQLELLGYVVRGIIDTRRFDAELDILRQHAEPAFLCWALLVRAYVPYVDDADLQYQIVLAEEACQLALTVGDAWLLSYAMFIRGRASFQNHDSIATIQPYFEAGLKYARQSGNPNSIATALNAMATIYFPAGRYQDGVDVLREAIELRDHLFQSVLINLYLFLSELLLIQGQFDEAGQMAQIALDQAYHINWRRFKIFALHRYAVVFGMQDFSIAEEASAEVLAHGMPDLAITVLMNSAFMRQDDARVEQYFSELFAIDGDDTWFGLKINAGIAKAHLGQDADAEKFLLEGLRHAHQRHWKQYYTSAIYGFAVLAQHQGNHQQANAYAQLVVNHYATEYIIRQRAIALLKQLGTSEPITPETDLEQLVQTILAE